MSQALNGAGHDALHVRDLGMGDAADAAVFDVAAADARTIVSADTDFAALLAHRSAATPSLILFRGETTRIPARQVDLLLEHLPEIESDLGNGCVAVFDGRRIRIRRLPL